ncbi:MAG: DciA family protein [Granulosicoccaceae bacterium]
MKPFFSKSTEISIPGATKTLQEHRRVYTVISRTVPPALLSDIQFCRIENDVLRVTVSNAAVLARLRFSASQIIDDLARQNIQVNQVNWHVNREKVKSTPRKKVAAAVKGQDEKSAKIVESTAKDMPDDELKRALMKMAKNLGEAASD